MTVADSLRVAELVEVAGHVALGLVLALGVMAIAALAALWLGDMLSAWEEWKRERNRLRYPRPGDFRAPRRYWWQRKR